MGAGATCYLVNVPPSTLHGRLPDEDVCKTVYSGLFGVTYFSFQILVYTSSCELERDAVTG